MWKGWFCRLLYLFLMAGIITDMTARCTTLGCAYNLPRNAVAGDDFRALQLSGEGLAAMEKVSEETGISRGSLLAAWMPEKGFALADAKGLDRESWKFWDGFYRTHRREGYLELLGACQAIWDDAVYFPVEDGMSYEDSWMSPRNYGGSRGHEGCDIMPPANRRGMYPVFSMTDGVVEKIGWLPQGGWRIGIRTPSGGYFYYAHLSDYGVGFQEGDIVHAGELLGYMGDSGYGPEGTEGKFDVHLHLGVYIAAEGAPEISVNPYWLLKSLEGHELKYSMEMCYTDN